MTFVSRKCEISELDIKKIALDGLIEFDKICTQTGLVYFLAFGTLLGAVRHSGFIPWDDDIDVLMPREDYERLCTQWNIFENTEWQLYSYRNNKKFLMPYMKLCRKGTAVMPSRFSNGMIYGISIDIFPLDFMDGDSEAEVKAQVLDIKNSIISKERNSYKTGVYEYGIGNCVKRVMKSTLYHVTPNRHGELLRKYREYDDLLANQSKKQGRFAFYMYNRYDTIWEKTDFFGVANTETKLDFETFTFHAPVNSDAVLSKTYGKYMELPPIEQQKTVHTFKAYYTR